MTAASRQIVGYDPITEKVEFEREIPAEQWGAVLSLVQGNKDDPDYFYSYPIQIEIASDIVGRMGERAKRNLNYFLESEAAD